MFCCNSFVSFFDVTLKCVLFFLSLISVNYCRNWACAKWIPVAASTAFSASWTVLCGLERLEWRPLWPWAERMWRKRTSLDLKKATRKACFSWTPLPVNSPASRGVLLKPAVEWSEQQGEQWGVFGLVSNWQTHSLPVLTGKWQGRWLPVVLSTWTSCVSKLCVWSIMSHVDWPWLSSRTSCRPRLWSGLASQRLLVAVRSKMSQPSSAAHTSRWSTSNRSTLLQEIDEKMYGR